MPSESPAPSERADLLQSRIESLERRRETYNHNPAARAEFDEAIAQLREALENPELPIPRPEKLIKGDIPIWGRRDWLEFEIRSLEGDLQRDITPK